MHWSNTYIKAQGSKDDAAAGDTNRNEKWNHKRCMSKNGTYI